MSRSKEKVTPPGKDNRRRQEAGPEGDETPGPHDWIGPRSGGEAGRTVEGEEADRVADHEAMIRAGREQVFGRAAGRVAGGGASEGGSGAGCVLHDCS